jgi:hypothetical protein
VPGKCSRGCLKLLLDLIFGKRLERLQQLVIYGIDARDRHPVKFLP